MKAIASLSPTDPLVDAYRDHLINVAGLQLSTCQKWTYFVRLFLKSQFKPKSPELNWDSFTPHALLDYVLQQGAYYPPGQLQSLASALRSFCRFLCVSGRPVRDLSAALPPISNHHREALPSYLSREQLQQLLQAFDRRTLVGQRDYAIVLCLARLGLRAGEVARLTLDDGDWRAGRIRLAHPKGRRERLLPLPEELGRAMATYLQHRRPAKAGRALFVSLRDGGHMSSDAVSARAVAALQRTAIHSPHKGAHWLRRTLASHLVQQGASLKAVADLLGHASLTTTQVYAKVNLPMLRQVAQPWPGEVRP